MIALEPYINRLKTGIPYDPASQKKEFAEAQAYLQQEISPYTKAFPSLEFGGGTSERWYRPVSGQGFDMRSTIESIIESPYRDLQFLRGNISEWRGYLALSGPERLAEEKGVCFDFAVWTSALYAQGYGYPSAVVLAPGIEHYFTAVVMEGELYAVNWWDIAPFYKYIKGIETALEAEGKELGPLQMVTAWSPEAFSQFPDFPLEYYPKKTVSPIRKSPLLR